MNKNTQLKDFKLLKKLGEGSYGKVYQVQKRQTNEIFALKEIKVTNLGKTEIQNTLNEIRILCSFEHQYICGYEEAFLSESGDKLYILMEFVGGGDLSSKIKECQKRKLRIQEKTIWLYLCQALIGLEALHKCKIIHRDIKAANLFLTTDFDIVKLGDLGVAKHAKNDLAQTQIGTPYYLAPEIWDNKSYDYRCDIFSLGVLTYEMAALKVPFQGVSLQDLYKNIKRGIIQKIPSNYSEDLYSIIKLMLSKNPQQRPNASKLLRNNIIQKKLVEFGLVNFDEIHKNLGTLMDTIVIPGKLSNLKSKLPKKRSRANSCQKLISKESIDDQEDLEQFRKNLNKMLRGRKQVLEDSKKINNPLPPIKEKNQLKSKPKIISNRVSELQPKIMSYQDYLNKISKQKQSRYKNNQRRFNSADKRRYQQIFKIFNQKYFFQQFLWKDYFSNEFKKKWL